MYVAKQGISPLQRKLRSADKHRPFMTTGMTRTKEQALKLTSKQLLKFFYTTESDPEAMKTLRRDRVDLARGRTHVSPIEGVFVEQQRH